MIERAGRLGGAIIKGTSDAIWATGACLAVTVTTLGAHAAAVTLSMCTEDDLVVGSLPLAESLDKVRDSRDLTRGEAFFTPLESYVEYASEYITKVNKVLEASKEAVVGPAALALETCLVEIANCLEQYPGDPNDRVRAVIELRSLSKCLPQDLAETFEFTMCDLGLLSSDSSLISAFQ